MTFAKAENHLQILELGAHIRRTVHFGDNLRLLSAPYGHENTVAVFSCCRDKCPHNLQELLKQPLQQLFDFCFNLIIFILTVYPPENTSGGTITIC